MEDITKATIILTNEDLPITQRTRALFYLKNEPCISSVTGISLGLKTSSVLLKHEICYVLGQMRLVESIETLRNVLSDINEDEIARHEAGEALGNLPDQGSFLKQFLSDESISVRETCYLAIKKQEELARESKNGTILDMLSPFGSVDPAFPLIEADIEKIKDVYLNDKCLYVQYKAMFALRNINNKHSIEILGLGFKHRSALFRHEIAFVFGQMKRKESVKFLGEMLCDVEEHEMVRHECAEALGGVGTLEAYEILKRFKYDERRIVRESVEVALDIHDYETGEEVEYAKI